MFLRDVFRFVVRQPIFLWDEQHSSWRNTVDVHSVMTGTRHNVGRFEATVGLFAVHGVDKWLI